MEALQFSGDKRAHRFFMMEKLEQVDPPYRPPTAMIIMPAHHFVLVSPGFFLDGVVEYQYAVFPFYLTNG
jgi:hypothetical protein